MIGGSIPQTGNATKRGGVAAPTAVTAVSDASVPAGHGRTRRDVRSVSCGLFLLGRAGPSVPVEPPFTVEIVGAERGSVTLVSGLDVEARRAVSEVAATDIIIVPSVLLGPGGWTPGRYPEIVDWARRQKKKILFVPDHHLGRNTAWKLGMDLSRVVQLPDPQVWRSSIKIDDKTVTGGLAALDAALQAPEAVHPRKGQVVELRFFGGSATGDSPSCGGCEN